MAPQVSRSIGAANWARTRQRIETVDRVVKESMAKDEIALAERFFRKHGALADFQSILDYTDVREAQRDMRRMQQRHLHHGSVSSADVQL